MYSMIYYILIILLATHKSVRKNELLRGTSAIAAVVLAKPLRMWM